MIYSIKTKKKCEEIKHSVEEQAKVFGFGLLHSYAFKEILQEKGHPIEKEITVFELCNPAGAQKVLTQMAGVSVYLPCRLSIYEVEDETVLATIDMEMLLQNAEIDSKLRQEMKELFRALKNIMQKLK